MSENDNNSVNDNILSGQGLAPIAGGSSNESGIITENRGVDISGMRVDSLNNTGVNKTNSGTRIDVFNINGINKK